MPLQIYPTFSSPGYNGNRQNTFPMLYYAPQNPYQHQQHPHYDPSTASFLAMPSLIPEQQPLYYTIDQHGNYVLTPNLSLGGVNSEFDGIDQHGNYVLASSMSRGTSSRESGVGLDQHSNYVLASNLSFGSGSRESGGSESRKSGGKSRNSPAYKTMMCNMFSTNGSCSYGAGCQYAHGKEEIRPTVPHPKYKTQLCNKFNTPRGCQYGEKCHFRHPDDLEAELIEKKKEMSKES
jgi:hypothetical protein